jgi:hypothetical protein
MEANQQQAPLSTGKCVKGRLEEVLGYVVIERSLILAHVVLVQPAAPCGKRPIQKFLCLTPKRALQHDCQSLLQLVFLPRHQGSVVLVAEDLPKRGDVAK